MRNIIIKVLGAALIAATTIQLAAASEPHARRVRESFRNSHASAAPAAMGVQPGLVHQREIPGYNDPSRFGGQTPY
jgi:hypothetical protein